MATTAFNPTRHRAAAKRRSIAALILAQVLALAPWFSGSASLPALRAEALIGEFQGIALTSAFRWDSSWARSAVLSGASPTGSSRAASSWPRPSSRP